MKLLEIWKRLGRQPLTTTKYQDAIVFIEDKEYIITKVRYESGRWIGFEAVMKNCSTCKNNVEFPHPHTCNLCTSIVKKKNIKCGRRKMRLIDAEHFIKSIRLYLNRSFLGEVSAQDTINVGELASLIKDEPTAYDIDNVISQLKETSIDELGITKNQFEMDSSEYSSYCSLSLSDVSRIVSGGGINRI